MSVEELRSFCQVPTDISLELSYRGVVSTVRKADNVVYFTHEQFATGLRFPILSLVSARPNVFRILMGCNVLKFLYKFDISLVEIFFIYTLKLRIGG